MPNSIQEVLQGQTVTDLARRVGCDPSVTSRLLAGKQQFVGAELARKFQGQLGIDLSGFVRKPDQKIPRRKGRWSLAAKRRLRRSRAAKRAWAEKRENGTSKRSDNPAHDFHCIRTGKYTCLIIDRVTGLFIGQGTLVEYTKEKA